MKLKRFPQRLLRKRLSRTTPSTREPLATNPPDYSIGYCWFLYHTGRPWRRLPTLLNHHGLKCLAAPLAIAPSAEDNIRPSHTPSRPDAEPPLRCADIRQCPACLYSPGCTDCARLRSPGHKPARCRPAPTRCTPVSY